MSFVISNLQLGANRHLTLSRATLERVLASVIAAGHELAESRWEREAVAWLGNRRDAIRKGEHDGFDLAELAFTPERFVEQQTFMLALVHRAADRAGSNATLLHALGELAGLVGDHPRHLVTVGRRWVWHGPPPQIASSSSHRSEFVQ